MVRGSVYPVIFRLGRCRIAFFEESLYTDDMRQTYLRLTMCVARMELGSSARWL
jgi:hypothetical protein